MYVSIYALYVRMSVRAGVRMHVCTYARMYVYTYVVYLYILSRVSIMRIDAR